MHQGVMDDGLLPEAGEVRGVMAQMEALLELLEGKVLPGVAALDEA